MSSLCDKILSAYINKTGMSPDDKMIHAICEVVGRELTALQQKVASLENAVRSMESTAKKFQAWSSMNTPLGGGHDNI